MKINAVSHSVLILFIAKSYTYQKYGIQHNIIYFQLNLLAHTWDWQLLLIV